MSSVSDTVLCFRNIVRNKFCLSQHWTLQRVNKWMSNPCLCQAFIPFSFEINTICSNCHKTSRNFKMSSKEHAPFLDFSFISISTQFQLQVLYRLVACGTENPEAFKQAESKEHIKLLWEGQKWNARFRHLIDAGLFGICPCNMFATLTGFHIFELELYSVQFIQSKEWVFYYVDLDW